MLASWNDSPAKRAIIAFVQRVTGAGPGFVPAAERIAGFDNDGTLWVERPMPPQFDFLLQTWAAEAQHDPSLASREPYKAMIEGDTAFFAGGLIQDPNVVLPPSSRLSPGRAHSGCIVARDQGAAEKPMNVVAYVFRPERIRYIDNALGFGTRVSLRLENGEAIGTPEYEDDQD